MKIDKLNFIAPLGKDTEIKGYHITTKEVIKLMDELGMNIRVQNLNGVIIPEFEHLQKKDIRDRVQLLREIPTVLPQADAFYTVTEFDQPTYPSIPLIRKARFIITESEFCKSVYEKITDKQVGIIQTPLHESFTKAGQTYKFPDKVEKFGYKFLAVFEWVMRKDPYTLIKAFVETFKPEEDVCLIIRSWGVFENPRKWIGLLGKKHNVFLMNEKVEDMSALYRACDCQATATLGEGFGRTYVESMACGMLNILPKHTAIKEYANNRNSIMINAHEQEVGPRINHLRHLIKPWFKINVPVFDELKGAMRYAFENKHDDLKTEALKIRDMFSIENTKNQIKEVFEL
jgi:glycosyltransferase involved in cell wall biosynthesis